MANIFRSCVDVKNLSESDKATLFGILSSEFLGTNWDEFNRDLGEKRKVIVLRIQSDEGEIVGFSTLTVFDLSVSGEIVKIVFSGDTAVLPPYRRSGSIGIEIGKMFLQTMEEFPSSRIYYLLLSKGWRTYRVMPFFFKSFVPSINNEVKGFEKKIIDTYAVSRHGNNYDRDAGLVYYKRETQRIIPGGIDAVLRPRPDSHSQFFVNKNPTYLSGTELICVGEVKMENLTEHFKRLIFQHIDEGP